SCGVVWVVEELPFSHPGPAYMLWSLPSRADITYALLGPKSQFDYAGDPNRVIIDLTDADIWDASTVAALDAVHSKYAAKGKHVEIVGLDGASLDRYRRLSGELTSGH
ncbi:STAS domain-containing protein, partial [Gordonia defluvii]|uniref:STAS domain-containing protein n=2 Tax=Gordonia TaxID=2053 RepID=UPI0031E0DACE